MKILLIKPHLTVFYNQAVLPLGLMYLSSVLKREGYNEVKIIHMYGDCVSLKDLEDIICKFRPDIIGLSALTPEAKCMHEIARSAKKIVPACLVVAGGPHPTAYVNECLCNTAIDLIVRGEGEYTFLEIVRNHERKIPFNEISGICFRRNGKIIHNPMRSYIENLDQLPYPDWDAINIDVYKNFVPQTPVLYKVRHIYIITSRGCPYR